MLQLAGSGIITIQNFKWDRVSHPSCTSHSFCCENIAHDAWNITNVPYDLSLASHEAVALSLPEEYQTKSIQVLTIRTVFDIILRNPIKEELPGCWRYLLSHSTMLRFPYLWAWPWCVNGALWKKEDGLVWRTFLVWSLVFCSCRICGFPMDRLVCVNKNWAHLSERNVPKLKSGKTYEAIAKEMLRYIHC